MAESRSLRFLYHTRAGRLVLKPLTARGVSNAAGGFLNTRLSKPMIKKFVKKNNIDLADFESDNFRCFNDCFCRRIKEGRRPINEDAGVLISPCDGLLSAYRISGDTVLAIKQSRYTVSSLLGDEELAAREMFPMTRDRVIPKSLKAYANMVSSADKGGVRIID